MISSPEALQILSRSQDVLGTEAGGEVALMSIPNGCYYALNPVASDIWRKLEQPVAMGELAASLMAAYDGDPARIVKDLRETVDEWLSHGLIVVRSPA